MNWGPEISRSALRGQRQVNEGERQSRTGETLATKCRVATTSDHPSMPTILFQPDLSRPCMSTDP
jgi:hypothetical protein